MPLPFKTNKKENFRSWGIKTLMNWYPMYFGTGGKILFWSKDNTEVQIQLRKNLWTYNYVGTIFGGSMYSATDPFYMVMILRILGNNFVVWDKQGSIKFIKPGKTTLFTNFIVTEQTLSEIYKNVNEHGFTNIDFTIEWIDKNKTVHAVVQKTIYIACKKYYESKKGSSQKAKLGK
jgi:Domain of unknown function (DUF4442)